MSLLEVFPLALTATGSLYMVWYWILQPLSLDHFGAREVQARLQREPAWVREPILARGAMTRDEWAQLVARQQQRTAGRRLRG